VAIVLSGSVQRIVELGDGVLFDWRGEMVSACGGCRRSSCGTIAVVLAVVASSTLWTDTSRLFEADSLALLKPVNGFSAVLMVFILSSHCMTCALDFLWLRFLFLRLRQTWFAAFVLLV